MSNKVWEKNSECTVAQVHYVGYRLRWLVWYLENGPRQHLGPFSRYQTATPEDRRVSHGLGWPANAMFFFLQQNSRKAIFYPAGGQPQRQRAKQVRWGRREIRFKVARNEVENASFAQRSAHRDSRIWRPELIEPAAERKRRARRQRPTFKSAYSDPQILPQCNISSNYPL